jgi:hypothetical protein
MGELGALFNPGMRHEIEERQSKASRREEEGQADPGNLRIDLLSGVAVINMGRTPAAQEDDVSQSGPDEVDENTSADGVDSTDDSEAVDSDATASDAAESDGTEESVQSSDPDSAESTRQPTADTGTAPAHHQGTDASADDDVDSDALDIARSTSNSEPPA